MGSMSDFRILWSAKSQNKKLGGIPACLVQDTTCPSTCPLKASGCYAKSGALGYHWRRLSKGEGISWDEFIKKVQALPEGTLWRYAVAGDLPGDDHISLCGLFDLVDANRGKRGFTYTHKPLNEKNRDLIRHANQRDFTINISAWDATDADRKIGLHVGPVVCLIPWHTPKVSKTPQGRTVIACPAQTGKATCKSCGLCAKVDRQEIIGFYPHGSGQGRGGRTLNERLKA